MDIFQHARNLHKDRSPYLRSNEILSSESVGPNHIIIEGIAADNSRDVQGDMAAPQFLAKMATDLNLFQKSGGKTAAPLYFNHAYNQTPIGKVLEARLIDGGSRVWVKCLVDTQERPDLHKGILDGRIRFFSVGGWITKSSQQTYMDKQTRVCEDGYVQELTITCVPIAPTAGFQVAKSAQDFLVNNYNNRVNLLELEWRKKSLGDPTVATVNDNDVDFNSLVTQNLVQFASLDDYIGSLGLNRETIAKAMMIEPTDVKIHEVVDYIKSVNQVELTVTDDVIQMAKSATPIGFEVTKIEMRGYNTDDAEGERTMTEKSSTANYTGFNDSNTGAPKSSSGAGEHNPSVAELMAEMVMSNNQFLKKLSTVIDGHGASPRPEDYGGTFGNVNVTGVDQPEQISKYAGAGSEPPNGNDNIVINSGPGYQGFNPATTSVSSPGGGGTVTTWGEHRKALDDASYLLDANRHAFGNDYGRMMKSQGEEPLMFLHRCLHQVDDLGPENVLTKSVVQQALVALDGMELGVDDYAKMSPYEKSLWEHLTSFAHGQEVDILLRQTRHFDDDAQAYAKSLDDMIAAKHEKGESKEEEEEEEGDDKPDKKESKKDEKKEEDKKGKKENPFAKKEDDDEEVKKSSDSLIVKARSGGIPDIDSVVTQVVNDWRTNSAPLAKSVISANPTPMSHEVAGIAPRINPASGEPLNAFEEGFVGTIVDFLAR